MTAKALDFPRIFSQRRECFANLLELSEEQRQLINQDDYTALLALQGRKLRVIGELEAIGQQHPELMPVWRSSRAALPASTRQACEALLAESERFLSELLAQERNDTQMLTDRRAETQRQLYGLTAGARAQTAYNGDGGAATHRVLDIDQ